MSLTVTCPNCHEFERDDALFGVFDGSEAYYQCPECGEWVEGPPPS